MSQTPVSDKSSIIIKGSRQCHVYIISYWIRIHSSSLSSSLSFPQDLIHFILQLLLSESLNGVYNLYLVQDSFYYIAMTLQIDTSKNNMFDIAFNAGEEPEDIDEEPDSWYKNEATLIGNDIKYDYNNHSDDKYILSLTDKSNTDFINAFNFILDHNDRKREYIQRIKALYTKHNIDASNIEHEFDSVVISNDGKWCREDLLIGDDYYSDDSDGNKKDKPKFIDYHDIYCKICNKLNEPELPSYIGGVIKIKIKDRYHLEMWIFYRADKFEYWEMRKKTSNYGRSPHYIWVTLKIDQEMNYYELFQEHGSCYNKSCEFKANGSIINDRLELSVNDASKLKSKYDIDNKHDLALTMKQSVDDSSYRKENKIEIYFGDNVLWEGLTKSWTSSSGRSDYYDYGSL